MKKYILLVVTLFSITIISSAQNAHFTNQGTITYEKKINMYALIKDEIKKGSGNSFYATAFDDYQRNNTQFKTLKSTLNFSKNQTLFTPIEDESSARSFFDFSSVSQNNVIATNTSKNTSIAEKKVFDQTYLLKDSTRKINWKITSEIRNIAGYDCRRANAIIMDSIYVVAFYTDEIPISGGPESFTGLPGMILGVALPYEHITWFASGVTEQPITDDKLKAPTKGKPVDRQQLVTILKAATKDWGDWAQDSLKAFLF